MKLEDPLPSYKEAFLRLFYPRLCACCRRLLTLAEKDLCGACGQGFEEYRLRPSEERIRGTLAYGDEAWALFRYEGAVKEIFHQIKFERRRDLLGVFDPALAEFLARRPALSAYDEVMPIPLDFRRRLEREFNQSGIIAGRVREILGKGRAGAVLRKRLAPPQSLLGREARRWNLEHAFRLERRERIAEKSVLLVDDIFTTGATLEAAAKILKGAGARRIGYFVLARTHLN